MAGEVDLGGHGGREGVGGASEGCGERRGAGRVQYWWAEEAAGGAGRADEASAGAMAVAERGGGSRRGRAEEAGAGPAGPSIELDEEEKDGRERKNRGDDKWAHK